MSDYSISISKERLAELPAAQNQGEIVVIDDPSLIEPAISNLRNSGLIGFDTETKPSFKKGQINLVSLIQLANLSSSYLFRINKIGFPDSLKELLENPDITKIGLSVHDDFHSLNKIAPLNPTNFIDLQTYVKQFHIIDNSLSRLYAILFDQRISKNQRLTNWEAENLTPAQLAYAALDARACLEIYDVLSKGLFHPDKSKYILTGEDTSTEATDNPDNKLVE